jgi:hypothetical protein
LMLMHLRQKPSPNLRSKIKNRILKIKSNLHKLKEI